MSLLEIKHLSLTFTAQNRQVLHDVAFALPQGQTLALVGESGSGKSVTARAILGLNAGSSLSPDTQILWQGRNLAHLAERDLRQVRGREIAMIFQEPMTALNPLLKVGEQIAEVLRLHENLSKAQAWARAVDLMARTRIADPALRAQHYPHQLSGGQRQRVMIAMALACRPRLLIADEPTTALDATVQTQILDLLKELQEEYQMAVLLISHDLNMVRKVADTVVVMQHGRVVESAACHDIMQSPQHPYTQQLLAASQLPALTPIPDDAPVVMQAAEIACAFALQKNFFGRVTQQLTALDQVGFTLRRGETLGIVGESGSGKSTLAMALLQLVPQAKGVALVKGQDWFRLSIKQLRPLRQYMQMVLQDPYASLSPRLTVQQILLEGLDLHCKDLSRTQKQDKIHAILAEVGLPEGCLNRYPFAFSGGQRQRIAIARALLLQPEILILDEPTSALDATVQQQVLCLLQDLQQKYGLSYIFISHDLQVVKAMSHQILVLKNGQVLERGDTQTVMLQPQHAYTQQLMAAYGATA